MTQFVIQKFNEVRGQWEDDAASLGEHEARQLLRDARAEGSARMIRRRV